MPRFVTPVEGLPSLAGGFACRPEDSEKPHLWSHLRVAFAPGLGISGLYVQEHIRGQHALANGAPTWDKTGDGSLVPFATRYDANTEFHTFPSPGITSNQLTIYTYARWGNIAADQPGTGWGRLIHHANTTTSDDWAISWQGSGSFFPVFRTRTTGPPITTEGTTNMKGAEWHHVMGVYNGSSQFIFVDDMVTHEKTDAQSGAINDSGEGGALGRHKDSDTRDFKGQLGVVLVYDRALFGGERQELADDPLGLFRLRRRVWPGFTPQAAAAATFKSHAFMAF